MPIITKIEPVVPVLPTRKRVAAYARISMETNRTLNSLSAQVSYYSEYIQKRGEWQYAGVYTDSGISGTSTKRPEFQRLLADCEAGKIDLIITKSISRFARNTVDLLTVVRHLKELGVAVYFEEQNINSLSGDGELMLTILASFAQSEVQTLSDNTKWSIRKRWEQGIPNGRMRLYGYKWVGEQLVIIPEEAAVVRRIFANFLAGKSRLETEREFATEGITTWRGYPWVDSNIKNALQNVHYTGTLLFQKYYSSDPITGKRTTNKGELPQYSVPNHHEPIIDPEVFAYVQAEMANRRSVRPDGHVYLDPRHNKSLNTTCFTSKIKCGACGCSFVRDRQKNKAKSSQLGDKLISWVCSTTKRKNSTCPIRSEIPERYLKQACTEVLGITEFDETAFEQRVERISVTGKREFVFHLTDGTVVTKTWVNNSKKEAWTPELRAAAAERMRKREYSPEQRKARSDRLTAYWKARREAEAAAAESEANDER